MEFQNRIEIHPVYGPVHKDGEYVPRGAVLGVSTDGKDVVVAPASGWVRLRREASCDHVRRNGDALVVEIWDSPSESHHLRTAQALST
jgi:hypothetical protein